MALPDVADTFKLDVKQMNQGEEIHNVFFYRDNMISPPTPTDVAIAFWNHVKAAWRAIPSTTSGYQFVEIAVQGLFTPYPFITWPIPLAEQTGTRVVSADQEPSFVAMYIELVVGNRSTRPGGKRISGWNETDIVGQNFVNAAFTLGTTLGALLDDSIVVGGAAETITPVIVGYPTPPPTSKPLRVQDVVGYLVDQRVSHQVSRDPRRT